MRFASTSRLSWLYWFLWAAVVSPVRGDSGPITARTSVAKGYKSEDDLPTEKYFHESEFHYHYDDRFAKMALSNSKANRHLSTLIQTYLSTMASIGAETWLMHGTLLAWWWNQKIFPWDNDLDVQVSEQTINFLAQYYNMSEHHFDVPGVSGSRTYLLDINPNYVVRSTKDKLNKIDARWIDTSSGLFIDITAVSQDNAKRASGHPEALMCKDSHFYNESDIFPLRNSYFEGVPAKIPYAYTALLEEEYGPEALTQTAFAHYQFNEETQAWVHEYLVNAQPTLRRGWRASDLARRTPGT